MLEICHTTMSSATGKDGNSTGHHKSRITLAIAGGGISGVCLALGILNHAPHIDVHVYEAAAGFGEVGAGVGLGINAQRALARIDRRLGAAYARMATTNADPSVDRRDGGRATYLRFVMGMDHAEKAEMKAGTEVAEVFCEGGFSSVHRARFLEEMVSLLPPDLRRRCVSFSSRVVRVDDFADDDAAMTGVKLTFADGRTATADAVIGCDGIKSHIRTILLGANSPAAYPVFSGKYAYRGLIPMDVAIAEMGDRFARNGHHHVGYGGHVLTFPIDHGNTLNVVAFRTKANGSWGKDEPWIQPASKEDMERDFAGWGPHVRALLRIMRTRDKWALFDHPRAPTYHRQGRICLLGDSAHASTPHQGAGAGMAIEDACVLAELLAALDGKEELPDAFAAFEATRKTRTQMLVDESREQASVYEFQGDDILDDISKIAQVLPSRWDWIWEHDIEADITAAKGLLDRKRV